LRRFPSLGVLLLAAAREFLVGEQDVDRAIRNVDADLVAVANEADGATRCSLRRAVADGQPRGAAGEAAIRQQRASLAETLRFDIARRIQHFLHTGAALRAFVANDNHVARLDLVVENVLHRFVLRFGDVSRALEHENAFVNTRGLNDATVERDVAGQHREAAFLGERMFVRADAALGTVEIKARPARILAERHLRGYAAGASHVEGLDGFVTGAGDV